MVKIPRAGPVARSASSSFSDSSSYDTAQEVIIPSSSDHSASSDSSSSSQILAANPRIKIIKAKPNPANKKQPASILSRMVK